MNRRDALRKLAAGGAVVIGASSVTSTSVLASGSAGSGAPIGSGLMTPPPPALPVNDKRAATWQITSSGVMCTSATLRVDSYAVATVLDGAIAVNVNLPGPSYNANAGSLVVSVAGTGPGNSPFRRGDAFEFTWFVRYVCVDGSASPSVACRNYRYGYENTANGSPNWVAVGGTPQVTTPASCPLP